MFTAIIVGAVVAVLIAAVWFISQRKSAQTAFVHFRCPECKQRLRFQAGKAGRGSICPRCLHRATLPLAG